MYPLTVELYKKTNLLRNNWDEWDFIMYLSYYGGAHQDEDWILYKHTKLNTLRFLYIGPADCHQTWRDEFYTS